MTKGDMTMSDTELTAEDIEAMRSEFYVSLEGLTDAELTHALAGETALLWKAREWGWSDIEVRDQTAELLARRFGTPMP